MINTKVHIHIITSSKQSMVITIYNFSILLSIMFFFFIYQKYYEIQRTNTKHNKLKAIRLKFKPLS